MLLKSISENITRLLEPLGVSPDQGKQLADELIKAIAGEFAGKNVYFGSANAVKSADKRALILDDFNHGLSVDEIVKKYGISRQWAVKLTKIQN